MKDKNEGEEPGGDEEAWSLLGFEFFDLLVMASQVIIFFGAVSLKPLFESSIFKFVIGVGFVVLIIFLSKTKAYARGVQKIESEHEHLWAVTFVGGVVLGILVLTLFIFGPIKQWLDYFELDSSWLPIPGVPLSIVAVGFLPFLSIRAGKKNLNEAKHFKEYPLATIYIGRGIILILANLILYTMYKDLAHENRVINTINAVAVMSLFYIPIRLQEMFLHPGGPHFQSLFQTLLFMALGNSGQVFFSE